MTKQQRLDEATKMLAPVRSAYAPGMVPFGDAKAILAATLEALAERDEEVATLRSVLGEIDNHLQAITDYHRLPWEAQEHLSVARHKAAPYRVKVDQDAEDLKALCAVWLGADYPRLEDGETWPAALAKFREIVAQRGD